MQLANKEIDLRKIAVPSQVLVHDKPGGKVIGTAIIKPTSTGSFVAEITITDRNYDIIANGCKLGVYSIVEED